METLRISLWSGPRNVSTALMYAFAQREDTRVLDEPLHGHYLEASGEQVPRRSEILAARDPDGERVVRDVILGPSDRRVLLIKERAHHLAGLEREFLQRLENVLLIRNPEEMIPALAMKVRQPRLRHTALKIQAFLFKELRSAGKPPIVIDAADLRQDPRAMLTSLCEQVGLEFSDAMLHWPPGAREEEGPWAQDWYDAVHRSTGFLPWVPVQETFPQRYWELLEGARPYYEYLRKHALRLERTD